MRSESRRACSRAAASAFTASMATRFSAISALVGLPASPRKKSQPQTSKVAAVKAKMAVLFIFINFSALLEHFKLALAKLELYTVSMQFRASSG